MIVLKGFVAIQNLISNSVNSDSSIGEISTWSLTYTKDRYVYENNSIQGYRLVGISSKDSTTGQELDLNSTLADQALNIAKSAYSYATAHSLPYDRQDFHDTLNADFFQQIANLNFGSFITNGNVALPEWIEWDSLTVNNGHVKIWLADYSFQTQFDEYSIVPVVPLDTLDNFFGLPTNVQSLINGRTASDTMDLIQAAKKSRPETVIRTMTFNYVSQTVPQMIVPTNWSVLIYGQAGDNPDVIKDAIIAYILANSSHSEAEWTAILPDLFRKTEFILIPRWDLQSIPNMTTISGLYSSLAKPADTISFSQAVIDFYSSVTVQTNINLVPYPYKGIMIYAIGSNQNVAGTRQILDLFPDYVPISTSSMDFARMQQSTKDWSTMIETMLLTAETMDAYSTIPSNMRRVTRGAANSLYLSSTFNNIQYLMLSKASLLSFLAANPGV